MVTWTMFENYLLEVGPTQNLEIMALQMLTPLIYSVVSCVKTCMIKNSFKYHLVEGSAAYGFTLHLRIHDHTT